MLDIYPLSYILVVMSVVTFIYYHFLSYIYYVMTITFVLVYLSGNTINAVLCRYK